MQLIQLDGSEPPVWAGFAARWRDWRSGFDRSNWPTSWQGLAWRAGQLTFPSPWGPGSLSTRLSVRREQIFGYVLQQGLQRALLLPGWLGGGHELEALFLLREQVLLLLPCSLADRNYFLLVLSVLLPQLVTWSPWPEPNCSRRPQRLILDGHNNFAHQLLNVLSALEPQSGSSDPMLWVGMEPYGPIDQIYPTNHWLPKEIDYGLGSAFELPLSQRSQLITSPVRQRLRQWCAQQLGVQAQQLLDAVEQWRSSGGRVLWISLQTRNARADGLPQLVTAWMQALKTSGQPLPLLLLDGFSLQHGDTPQTPYYGTNVAALLDEEKQLAAAVHAALADLEPQVHEAIGLRLSESLALGAAVDGYLCHQGTLQHKLGWLQEDVPGVVHSSSWRNQGGSHPWGGMGGCAPLWLPPAFIEDLDQGPRAAYRFRSDRIDEAGRWLAEHVVWRQG